MSKPYVKITNPDGRVNVVPAASNRAYYEKFNAQEKDQSKRYKIEEPTDEEVAKYFPEVAQAAAEKKERLAAVEAKLTELTAAKEESDKARETIEAKVAELTTAKEGLEKQLAAANRQVEKLQKELEKAAAK